jgi:hypothetical protein
MGRSTQKARDQDMAATRGEHECRREEGFVPAEGAASASNRVARARPITITSAAVYGALVSGLVAFLQGGVAFVVFGVTLGRVGFFRNWRIETTYAGRSLLGLLLVVLVTAAVGALAWSLGALIWNKTVADPMGRVRVASAVVMGRVRVALAAVWRRLSVASAAVWRRLSHVHRHDPTQGGHSQL